MGDPLYLPEQESTEKVLTVGLEKELIISDEDTGQTSEEDDRSPEEIQRDEAKLQDQYSHINRPPHDNTAHGSPLPTTPDPNKKQEAINATIKHYENRSAEITDALQQPIDLIKSNKVKGKKKNINYLKLSEEDNERLIESLLPTLLSTISSSSFILQETYMPNAKSTPDPELIIKQFQQIVDYITNYQSHPYHRAINNEDGTFIYLYDPIINALNTLKLSISEITAHLSEYLLFIKYDLDIVSTGRTTQTDYYGNRDPDSHRYNDGWRGDTRDRFNRQTPPDEDMRRDRHSFNNNDLVSLEKYHQRRVE